MNRGSIAPRALYQEVVARLRERIFSHDLAPGAWIDEQALAGAYGISRTPMREALKVLAAEGLVTLQPRRGCFVSELSPREVEEIYGVLALLEGRSAYEATEKAQPEDLRRLEALHEELERSAARKDRDGFFDVNQRFHRELNATARNRWMLQVVNGMRKILKLARYHSLLLEGRLQESLAEHRGIMAAIRERDPALAEERTHAHILRGRDAMAKISSSGFDGALQSPQNRSYTRPKRVMPLASRRRGHKDSDRGAVGRPD